MLSRGPISLGPIPPIRFECRLETLSGFSAIGGLSTKIGLPFMAAWLHSGLLYSSQPPILWHSAVMLVRYPPPAEGSSCHCPNASRAEQFIPAEKKRLNALFAKRDCMFGSPLKGNCWVGKVWSSSSGHTRMAPGAYII